MIVSVEEVKDYLRIDNNEDDCTIQLLIDAAEEYLFNTTGRQHDSSNQLAKLFCLVLVCDWYENRQLVGRVGEKVRYIINSMAQQLSYCGDNAEE